MLQASWAMGQGKAPQPPMQMTVGESGGPADGLVELGDGVEDVEGGGVRWRCGVGR